MLGLEGRVAQGNGDGDLARAAEAAGITDFDANPFDDDNPDAREVNDHERLWMCTDYQSAFTHWTQALGNEAAAQRIRQVARDLVLARVGAAT